MKKYILIFIFISSPSVAGNYGVVPVSIQAALFCKLLVFNQEISTGSSISIYIVGASDFANEMQQVLGKKIGKSKITSILEGTGLPDYKPSIIYVGNTSKADALIVYARQNKVLTITGIPELVSAGVTLGLGVLNQKPRILLNILASKEEGINWNPTIFKIAVITK